MVESALMKAYQAHVAKTRYSLCCFTTRATQSMNTDPTEKQTLYMLIGGDTGVRSLVDRFYDLMEQDTNYSGIRKLHPPSLNNARDKLYWYLSGWMGGPELYVERFGHPRMRMRQAAFSIGTNEKDQWLACMKSALQDTAFDEPIKIRLMQAFGQIAEAIRNQPE